LHDIFDMNIGGSFSGHNSLHNIQGDTSVKDLTQNFRCHQGVLDLTSALVDPIVKFFRDTTDELPREWSVRQGAVPVI